MAFKVAIEGLSGSGKTTLIEGLATHFRSLGLRVEVIDTETVGYAPLLREIIGQYHAGHIVGLLLFWVLRYQQYQMMASRDPETDIIFMNRSWEGSTVAYDFHGHGVPARVIRWVRRHIPSHPNLTIFLDVPIEVARRRKDSPTLRDDSFAQRVYEGYMILRRKSRWVWIDAGRDPADIQRECRDIIERWLSRRARFSRFFFRKRLFFINSTRFPARKARMDWAVDCSGLCAL